MVPHANSPDPAPAGPSRDALTMQPHIPGIRQRKRENYSHLTRVNDDELHDIICAGFGPASLAIAVALHDALDSSDIPPELASLQGQPPKVAFIERQQHFAWHSGMLLEGARMQISFIKDMATMRNPRSAFTFLNYLYEKNRIVQFTNLDTFLPLRVEFEDYLRWCADWFQDIVHYGQEVLDVQPQKVRLGGHNIDSFCVRSRDVETGQITTRRARHVVIAVGGKPNIPQCLPQRHLRIIHSSRYIHLVPQLLKSREYPYRVAVIGGGQSAAEIFDDVQSRYPNSRTRLLIQGAALRPSDDSPFVNEIFDPDRVDGIYAQSESARHSSIAENKGTNYGVVRLNLLERIYEILYAQRIRYDNEEDWPHRILSHRYVVGAEDLPDGQSGIRLHVRNDTPLFGLGSKGIEDMIDVDLVVVATGYKRNMHEEMLKSVQHLMRGGHTAGKSWNVSREYRVQFEPGTVSEDAGIWLQGCNEGSHGLSDTLLSILAVRGGEMVRSIFGENPISFAATRDDPDVRTSAVNGVENLARLNGQV